jgi:formylglycine-generating enzyme required for sulfatase activity
MPWPLSQDYNEAVQNPASSFTDPELRGGEAAVNALGMPLPCSGNFADVYKFTCPGSGRTWAVKCFTRQIPGLRERYEQISLYLQQVKLPFLVDFTFLDQGIRVRGDWYPVLKMQWVEGQALNQFVRDHVEEPAVLQTLGQIWVKLAGRLREAQLAHCDLQHGNVLLVPGSRTGALAVKLVDYDGMCVPALTLLKSIELGHANFQHPQRAREGIYNLEVDRFSHLVIYTAVRSLVGGGRALWQKYDNGDNLLFRQEDFDAPGRSPLFAELLQASDRQVHDLAAALIDAARGPLDRVPLLTGLVPEERSSPRLAPAPNIQVQPAAAGPRPAPVMAASPFAIDSPLARRRRKSLPAWIAAGAAVALLGILVAVIVMVATKNARDSKKGQALAHRDTAPEKGKGPSPDDSKKWEPLPSDNNKVEKKKGAIPGESKKQPGVFSKDDSAKTKNTAPLPNYFKNSLGMEFVLVPRGKSWLGGGGGKPGTKEVQIPEDFYLGKYLVTQREWQAVMGNNPSHFSRAGPGGKAVRAVSDADLERFPVENVSWDDAQVFLKRLNEREGRSGWVYRLPREAEWEYACRGGPLKDRQASAFDFYFDRPANELLTGQANVHNVHGRTCKVGSYPPNPLGLYDMHGNVWEWCDDRVVDPKNLLHNAGGDSPRVERGGCWHDVREGMYVRAAARISFPASYRDNHHGLRVAWVPVGKDSAPIPPVVEKKPTALPKTFTNGLGMEFVLVPKGRSWLGGSDGKPGERQVDISRDFYLGKYEVTQEEWEKVTGVNPSEFKAVPGVAREELKRFPVERVSWDDCQAFIRHLNEGEKEAGWVYRLPKEAEWEYACRGGPMKDRAESAFDFYLAKPANVLLPEQANWEHDKGMKRTCKVGSYPPNRLGLHDMHGNVWEWCEDASPAIPKVAPKGEPWREARGGSWADRARLCRAAYRDSNPVSRRFPNLGLRVARVRIGMEGQQASK